MISRGSGKELRDFHLLCEKFKMCTERPKTRIRVTRVEAQVAVNAGSQRQKLLVLTAFLERRAPACSPLPLRNDYLF